MITTTVTFGIVTVIALLMVAYGLVEILNAVETKLTEKHKYGGILFWLLLVVFFNISLILLVPLYFIHKRTMLKEKRTPKQNFVKGVKRVIPYFALFAITVNVTVYFADRLIAREEYKAMPLYQKLTQSSSFIEFIDGGTDIQDDGLDVYPIREAWQEPSESVKVDNEEMSIELVPTNKDNAEE